jgi:hypothetical protein
LRPLVTPRSPASATVRVLKRLRVEHVALARTLRAGDRAGFASAARAVRSDEGQLDDQLNRWQGLLRGWAWRAGLLVPPRGFEAGATLPRKAKFGSPP